MWEMLWPILLVVLSNTFYHICSKSVPSNANAFGALMVTYIVAAILTGIIFLVIVRPENAVAELHNLNWASIVLAAAIVGLELGNIFMYRAGWDISSGAFISNICLAIVLIFVGAFLFSEDISLKQVLGIFVCMVGLFLVNMG